MSAAARTLAHNVATVVSHDPVSLTMRNLTALGPDDEAAIRKIFEAELKAAGEPAAQVQLTISENLTQFVLVAEIRRSGEQSVLLESWPRSAAPSTAHAEGAAPRVTLDRKLLWEQDQPILDATETDGTVLVLDAARVLMIRGAQRQSVPIQVAHPWPRDLRGYLSATNTSFTAWLPGAICRGSLRPQLSMECRDSEDPWLIGPGAIAVFSATRNLFTGHVDVQPGGVRDLPPFYSAAQADGDWVFAGADGRAHIYTPTWEPAGSIEHWGSDLAGVQTPCGARILATRATSLTEPDALQPFALSGSTAIPSGPALEFPGPVTALWTAGSWATAVTRDLETGHYAAFGLYPACGS